MRSIEAQPGHPETLIVANREVPRRKADEFLLRTLLLGVCATDRDVLIRKPPESHSLVLGHEVVAVVEDGPDTSTIKPGSLVVGLVRRPCAVHCESCVTGHLDSCLSDRPSERGIIDLDGFGSDYWTSAAKYLVPIPRDLGEHGVLVEPCSAIVKGLRRVLPQLGLAQARVGKVYGAGTIGFLTCIVLRDRGFTPLLIDPFARGTKHRVAEELGIDLRTTDAQCDAVLVVEASGSPDALGGALATAKRAPVLVLGLYRDELRVAGDVVNRWVYADLDATFSVNASWNDYNGAAGLLARQSPSTLSALITRELALDQLERGLQSDPEEIKTVFRFSAISGH